MLLLCQCKLLQLLSLHILRADLILASDRRWLAGMLLLEVVGLCPRHSGAIGHEATAGTATAVPAATAATVRSGGIAQRSHVHPRRIEHTAAGTKSDGRGTGR
jgi:hypothetical protein